MTSSKTIGVASALVAILLCATIARFYEISRQSLFVDEFWNLELATGRGSLHLRLPAQTLLESVPNPTSLDRAGPWWTIPAHMDGVTHPPLFSILLRFWIDIFGTGDGAARALSALLSIASILLLFDVARIHNGTSVALWASAIIALAGAQVELAQEIRPYTLLMLFGLASLDAMVRIERDGFGTRRVIALGICVIGMLFIHYFSIAAVFGMIVYSGWRLRGRERVAVLVSFIVGIAMFAFLWGPFMFRQGASLSTGDEWLGDSNAGHLLRTIRRLAILPMLMLFNPQRNAASIIYACAVVLIIPLLLVRRRPQLLLWIIWFWATVGAMTAMEIVRSTRHLEFLRYTLLASPAIYVMLAEIVPTQMPALVRNAVPAMVMLCCALSLSATYYPWKPDYRPVARQLDEHVRPGEAVIFCTAPGSNDYAASLFMGITHYARSYPWPIMIVEKRPDDQTLRNLRATHSAVWIVAPMGGLRASSLFPHDPVDTDSKQFLFVPEMGTCERVIFSPEHQ